MADFPSFFHGWISSHEEFLRRLEALMTPVDGFDRECADLIPAVIAHYQHLYAEKAAAAADDVFLLLAPPWLSTYERSLLWLSGFRPSMFFPILTSSVGGELSVDQWRRMEEVKAESRRQEKEITMAMARIQETVAEQPVYTMMKRLGRMVDRREIPELGGAVEEVKAKMLGVIGNADDLQGWTVTEVVGVLTPLQGVKFLTALVRFQLQARRWGMERDANMAAAAAAEDGASPP